MTLIVHCLIVQRLVVKYWTMSVMSGVTSILILGVSTYLSYCIITMETYRVNGVQLLESEDEGTEYFAPDPFIVNRYLLEGLSLGPHEQPDLFQ